MVLQKLTVPQQNCDFRMLKIAYHPPSGCGLFHVLYFVILCCF